VPEPAAGAEPAWFGRALAERPELVETVVAGTVVRARCWGSPGPGIVLIHGGAAHAAWWDHIGPLLSVDRRVVAVDLSGHGSSGHRTEYTLATWSDEVAALGAAAGISGPPVVVGHSMGGYVALTLGGRQPQAVGAVIVIDSPVPSLAPAPALTREPTAESMRRRYASKDEVVRRFRVIPPDPWVLPYVAAHVADESVVEVEGGWTWKFDPISLSRDRALPTTLLSALPGRLAILRAEHGLITREIAVGMLSSYGRAAPVVELPGTGHHVPLDDPIALVVALRTMIAAWDSVPR
jgi:pimeloyl-ACP methyl ester carboxylesterase